MGRWPRRGRLGRLGGGERGTLSGGTVGDRMVECGRDCDPGIDPVTRLMPVPPASVGNSSRINIARWVG